jgi:SRSO17 transposase
MPPLGDACPPEKEPRGHGGMIGRGLQRFRPAQPDGMQDEGYLELADRDASDYDSGQSGLWTRGLLIRRNLADGECAYFTTWCPAGTGIETLVAVEGQRWNIEDGFETGKNELGLDHNETRSWHGWHRHVSLVMLAFAMLATIRHHANRQPPHKPPPPMIRKHNQLSSTGRRRKSAASSHGLRSGALSLPMSSLGRSGGGPIRPPQNALT